MTMQYIPQQLVAEAATAVQQRLNHAPTIGLVLGSGLSSLADAIQSPDVIPTTDIPHWPASTAPGHTGRLIIGELEGKSVLVLQGRVHFYEGYSQAEITFPVRVMRALGIKNLILTNAAGGMNPNFTPGDLMLIDDHLNMPAMAGNNPLRGPNDPDIGPRFPDMIEPYSIALRALAKEAAQELNITLQEGVYAYVAGPSYETRAELNFLRMAGGDAVGMSTAPSAVVARHAGIPVLGISTITNMAVSNPAPGTELSHAEVLEVGNQVIPKLTALIHGVLKRL